MTDKYGANISRNQFSISRNPIKERRKKKKKKKEEKKKESVARGVAETSGIVCEHLEGDLPEDLFQERSRVIRFRTDFTWPASPILLDTRQLGTGRQGASCGARQGEGTGTQAASQCRTSRCGCEPECQRRDSITWCEHQREENLLRTLPTRENSNTSGDDSTRRFLALPRGWNVCRRDLFFALPTWTVDVPQEHLQIAGCFDMEVVFSHALQAASYIS